MTEQEIQAAAVRWKASEYGYTKKEFCDKLIADAVLLANAHPLVSPPPTLEAADGEGWWWHVYETYGDRQCEPVFVWPIDGRWYCRSTRGRLTEAAGGLWQRVIGPFGMEGEA